MKFDFLDDEGQPLKGVRYTEARLASLFNPAEEGFAVLKALAYQQVSLYTAAVLIQKLIKGHKVTIPAVDTTKALKPYLTDDSNDR